jgi:hypothetical protein
VQKHKIASQKVRRTIGDCGKRNVFPEQDAPLPRELFLRLKCCCPSFEITAAYKYTNYDILFKGKSRFYGFCRNFEINSVDSSVLPSMNVQGRV